MPWVLRHETFPWWIHCDQRNGLYLSPTLTQHEADATRFPTRALADAIAGTLLSYRPHQFYHATEVSA